MASLVPVFFKLIKVLVVSHFKNVVAKGFMTFDQGQLEAGLSELLVSEELDHAIVIIVDGGVDCRHVV